MNDDVPAILLVVIVILISMAGGFGIAKLGEVEFKRSAIKAGVGHYQADPATGITTFVWITITNKVNVP